MNYSKLFRSKAVVDWMEFLITLKHSTNYHTLNNRFGLFFTPLNGSGHGDGTLFRFRLQDVRSWDDAQARLNRIESLHPFSKTPEPTAIEIAFDNYTKIGASVHDLARLIHRLYRRVENLPTGSRRFFGKKGEAFERSKTNNPGLYYEMDANESLQHFAGLETFYIGNQPKLNRKSDNECSPVSLRFYVKTIDNGKALPESKWRARMEVTLCGTQLPFNSIAEARKYNIAELATFFKFREWDREAIVSAATRHSPGTLQFLLARKQIRIIANQPQIGQRQPRPRRKGGGVLQHAPFTKADGVLNDRARNALRRLNKSLSKTSVATTPAKTKTYPGAEIRVFPKAKSAKAISKSETLALVTASTINRPTAPAAMQSGLNPAMPNFTAGIHEPGDQTRDTTNARPINLFQAGPQAQPFPLSTTDGD